MGSFGVDQYGSARFGTDPSLVRVDFSIKPFKAVSLDYSTLQLTWVKPQATTCTQLQLVRNSYNLPANERDGLVLFSQDPSVSLSLLDTKLSSGFNYYSMFGWDGINNLWIRSGDLIALVPTNYMSWLEMYNSLPDMYRERDYILLPPVNSVQDVELAGGYAIDAAGGPPPATQTQSSIPTIQGFFHLLGFQADYLRSVIDSLLLINNPQYCSGGLLPYMAFQLGMIYEPDLGMSITRSLISNAVHLYKLKGSIIGIEGFISIITGFGALAVILGYNRMLGYDDSVMAASLGTWSLYPVSPVAGVVPAINLGAVISQVPNLLTASPATTDPTLNIGFIPGQASAWQYNSSGMKIVSGPNCIIQAVTGPIPINGYLGSAGLGDFTVTFQIWSPTTSRTVSIFLTNEVGTIISSIVDVGVTNPGHWVTITADLELTSTMGSYVIPHIQVAATPIVSGYHQPLSASEVVYITLVGFYAVDSTAITSWATTLSGWGGPYDFPRDLKIYLAPTRSNLIGNPLTSMSQGLDGWISGGLNILTPSAVTATALLYEEFAPSGDISGFYDVYGVGGMTVTSLGYADTVVYGGAVSSVVSEPRPSGWLTSSWFPGTTTVYTQPRTWFSDPDSSWFMENNAFFGLNPVVGAGVWFVQPAIASSATINTLVPSKNVTYTFSIYIRSLNPGPTSVKVGIWWHFPDGTVSTTFSVPIVTSTGGFSRVSVSAQTPLNASGVPADQMLGVVDFINAPTNSLWYLNAAMFDPSPSLEPYFDSSLFPTNADYSTDSHGASYYYPQKISKMTRLKVLLPYFVPSGTTWTLVFSAGATNPPSQDPTTISA